MAIRMDFITALVLVAFGALTVVESWRMPRFERIGGSLATAPGLVPGLLGLIIVLLGLVMLVRSVRLAALVRSGALEVQPAGAVWEGYGRLAVMIVLSVGYAGFVVGMLPFWLATLAYVSATIAIFDWRAQDPPAAKARVLAVAAAIGTAVAFGVAFLFERIFLVTLP